MADRAAAKANFASKRKARAREQVKPVRSIAPTAIPGALRRAAIPPGGRGLPRDVRALMESRFGVDFSHITVHDGADAQRHAGDRDANAYALGEHIVFDRGHYAPHSAQGQRLLAHELAHVVQQRRGGGAPSAASEQALEANAGRAADQVAAGKPASVTGASGATVMCDRSNRKKRDRFDDDDGFDSDEAPEHRRREADKQRAEQRRDIRFNKEHSAEDIIFDQAVRDLSKIEEQANAPGGNQRGHRKRKKVLGKYERLLPATMGPQDQVNTRKSKVDEAQRTSRRAGARAQTVFVAGGEPVPDQEIRRSGKGRKGDSHTRPDVTVIKHRADGTLERVHINLKAHQLHTMTESEARAAVRPILYQAVKNKAHLPAGERLIISFARLPDERVRDAIVKELFRENTPVSEIHFDGVVYRNRDYNPKDGREPLDVDAKDRRRRLAAEEKKKKRTQTERKKAEDAAARAAGKAKKDAEKAAEKAKREAKKAAEKTAREAKKAADKAEREARKAAEKAGKQARRTAENARKAARKEADKAKQTANKSAKKTSTAKPPAKKAAAPDAPVKKATVRKSPAKRANPRARTTSGSATEIGRAPSVPTQSRARKQEAGKSRKSQGGRKSTPAQPAPEANTAPSQQPQAPTKKPAPVSPPKKPPTKVQPPAPAQARPPAAGTPAPPLPAPAKPKAPAMQAPSPQPATVKQTVPPPTAPKKPSKRATAPGVGGKGAGIARSSQRQSFFNDQVRVTVEEQLGAAKPFRVITSITLRGGGHWGGQASKGNNSASASASASASLSISYSRWMTAPEKNQYLESVSRGHGAGHAESTIIELIATHQQDAAAEAITRAKARMGDRQQGQAGDTEEISVEGDVSAGAGASRGGSRGVGGHVELSSGKGIRRTRTLMEDGKELYTVTVTLRAGQSLGGTLQYGAAGGGHTDTRDETRTVYFSFLLDPNDTSEYSARKNEILAASSAEELNDLANKHRHLAYGRGQSKADNQSGTTSFSVLGMGLDFDQGSFYEEGESEDPGGKQRHVRGGAGVGGSVTILGRRINPSSKTGSFTGWTDENNVGGGVTQTESREIDLKKTAIAASDATAHPIESAIAIVNGKSVLKDRVDTVGVNLTDDSFTVIAESAKSRKAWFKAWTARGVSRGSKDDWEAARQEVLAADGDRTKIQQALAKWEKGDSGRSAEVEKLVGNTGVSFDFPDEISELKPTYDQLVMGDIMAAPRKLIAEGKTSEAVALLQSINQRAGELLQSVQMHSGQATDAARFSAVQSNIAARQKQLRQEIHRLTSPAAKAAAQAGEPPPAPVAAPPPDFVGPLSVEQQEAVNAERKEASETIHAKVGICLVNRDLENKAFAEVEDELDDFYVSRAFIFQKLASLKPLYTTWDQAIAELKAAYPKQGDPPDRANQFAPNRARWNALNHQALK